MLKKKVLLRTDGEAWLVFNAHLPYLPTLGRVVGPTTIMKRTSGYLVTRSTRVQRGVGDARSAR